MAPHARASARILGGLAALTAALAIAAPAQAASTGVVTREGTTLHVDFGTEASKDLLRVNTPAPNKIELSAGASGGTLTDSAADCDRSPVLPRADTLICTVADADRRLLVDLGPGGDFTEFQTWTVTSVRVEVHGGEGDDPELRGTGLDDIVDGGPGDDQVSGAGGDDTLQGGAGDDRLTVGPETDDVHGGPGFDIVDYSLEDGPARITLDDVADDGPAGNGDNVHTDVEDVIGTTDADTIVGSAAGNIIDGRGGDDVIDGGGGTDVIDGDDGNDSITSFDGLAERVDCGDGADTLVADAVDVTDGCESEQRSPELQTDLDADGAARPADCDDRSAAIRPGALDVPDDGIDQNCDGADATDADRDRDGFPRGVDCDDADPRAHPGARERPGNRTDEDCNGRAEPFAVVTNGVPNAWTAQGSITRNVALGVRDVRAGMTVELRCGGAGCPFARKLRKVERPARLLDLHPLLRDARLRAGARLELRIERPGTIGKVVRYAIRKGAPPQSRALCLPPRAKRAREC
jgi:hypothetical protein